MKNKLALIITLSSVCFLNNAFAVSTDLPATLNINGTAFDSEAGCTVSLGRPAMELGQYDAEHLPYQGHYKSDVSGNVNMVQLSGDNCKSNSGKTIAIRFIGEADSVEGNSFVNNHTGSDAAQGIAVGIYGYADSVITPNTSQVLAFNNEFMFSSGMVKLRNSVISPGSVESKITVEVDRL